MSSIYIRDYRLIPPAPACFDTRSAWLEYVRSAQASGDEKRCAAPFAGKKWNVAFSPCRDCTTAHEYRMHAAGRCTRNDFSWMVPEEATA